MAQTNMPKPGKNGYKIVFASNTVVMNYILTFTKKTYVYLGYIRLSLILNSKATDKAVFGNLLFVYILL